MRAKVLEVGAALATAWALSGCGDDTASGPGDASTTSSGDAPSTGDTTTTTPEPSTTLTTADSSSDDDETSTPEPDLPREPSPVVINEVMAANDSTINGPDGLSTPDWLELVNVGTEPVELSRFELRSDAGDAWVPSSGVIAPGEHLVVGLDDQPGAAGQWTGWSVDKDMGALALHFDGHLAELVEWTEMGEDISFARIPDSTGDFVLTAWPTPAVTNGDLASPTLDPAEETVFLTDVVHRIDFTLQDGQSNELDQPDRPEVTVDARIDGIRFAGVGIRLKGSASYDTMNGKPAFVVDMNHVTQGQEFRGLSAFKLHNGSVIDPTRARDHITYMLAREVGLLAPRVGWAELYVNDEYYGIYMFIERHDDALVEARRPGAGDQAMIFEPMVGWEGDFGSQQTQWDYEDGPEPAPQGGLDALDAIDDIVSGFASDQAVAELWQYMDPDMLHTYMAWETVVGHYDGYKAPNNWRVYVDATTNMVELVPSGAEWTWDFDVDLFYYGGNIASWCLSNDGCAHDYAAKVIEVADAVESLGLLDEFIEQSEFLAPYIEIDPRYPIYTQGSYWYPYGTFDYAYPTTIERLTNNPGTARMLAIQAFPDLG